MNGGAHRTLKAPADPCPPSWALSVVQQTLGASPLCATVLGPGDVRWRGQSLFWRSSCLLGHSRHAREQILLEKEWTEGWAESRCFYSVTSAKGGELCKGEGPQHSGRVRVSRQWARLWRATLFFRITYFIFPSKQGFKTWFQVGS